MKKLISLTFMMVLGLSAMAQEAAEEQEVKNVIETFFEGFHSRDSTVMKSVVNDKVVMQSISRDSRGEIVLNHEDFGKFLRSIMAIPGNVEFREELHSYTINIDGPLANVWTPYSLYVNGTFRHCGVNNFQLFNRGGEWEIIYVVDTRREEGCDQKNLE